MIEKTTNKTIYITNEQNENVIFQEIVIQKTQDQINGEAKEILDSSDWQIIRHKDQKELGIETSLTDQEYIDLLLERQATREEIINL